MRAEVARKTASEVMNRQRIERFVEEHIARNVEAAATQGAFKVAADMGEMRELGILVPLVVEYLSNLGYKVACSDKYMLIFW